MLMLNIEFISLVGQNILICPQVRSTREDTKFLSHSSNKFHIQRQTIEYPLSKFFLPVLTSNFFYLLLLTCGVFLFCIF